MTILNQNQVSCNSFLIIKVIDWIDQIKRNNHVKCLDQLSFLVNQPIRIQLTNTVRRYYQSKSLSARRRIGATNECLFVSPIQGVPKLFSRQALNNYFLYFTCKWQEFVLTEFVIFVIFRRRSFAAVYLFVFRSTQSKIKMAKIDTETKAQFVEEIGSIVL